MHNWWHVRGARRGMGAILQAAVRRALARQPRGAQCRSTGPAPWLCAVGSGEMVVMAWSGPHTDGPYRPSAAHVHSPPQRTQLGPLSAVPCAPPSKGARSASCTHVWYACMQVYHVEEEMNASKQCATPGRRLIDC